MTEYSLITLVIITELLLNKDKFKEHMLEKVN